MKTLSLRDWCATFFLSVCASLTLLFQPSILDHLIPRMDYWTHLRLAYQFSLAIEEGIAYPRWVAAHGSLGEPVFLYYEPLFYYLVSCLNHFLADIGLSVRISLLVANIILGMASFSAIYNRFASLCHAWTGMFLIQLTPVLFFLETYYAALPWVFASPFTILFARESAANTPKPVRLAVWLALLILSHILSALMVLLSIGLSYLLLLIFRHPVEERLRLTRWISGVIIGLLLSSIYLYPAMTLQPLISPHAWVSDLTLDWHRAFAFPIFTYSKYGLRWFAMQWPLPILVIITLIAAMALSKDHTNHPNKFNTRLVCYASIALFFSSELAYPFYAVFGFLQKVQQPYRFITPATLLASLALALCLPSILHVRPLRWPTVLGYISLVLTIFLAVMLQISLYKQGQISPTLAEVMKGDFGEPEYITASHGANWHEYVRRGGWQQECLERQLTCTDEHKSTHQWSSMVTAPQNTPVRLPLFFFPAWQVELDDNYIEVQPDKETGLISLEIPDGMHHIQINRRTLPEEHIGSALSLAGLLGLFLLCLNLNVTRLLKHEVAAKFVKFCTVGALGTACHYLLLVLMVSGLGISPVISTISGASLGALVNYWLNKSFTFRSSQKHSEALPRFMFLAASGLLLNAAIVAWLTKLGVFYLIAQIFATSAILIINYIFSRIWVFQMSSISK